MIDWPTQHETVSELGAQSGDGGMAEARTVDEQHVFPSARSPAQTLTEMVVVAWLCWYRLCYASKAGRWLCEKPVLHSRTNKPC